MTSRAVKHQAQLAKRAKRLEEERQIGLAAQKLAHEKEAHRKALLKVEADRINKRHQAIFAAAERAKAEARDEDANV